MQEPGEEIIFLVIAHSHACVQNKGNELRKSASFWCFSSNLLSYQNPLVP